MLTKDSVTVSVDAVVYYRVSNATVSVANVEDAHSSTRYVKTHMLAKHAAIATGCWLRLLSGIFLARKIFMRSSATERAYQAPCRQGHAFYLRLQFPHCRLFWMRPLDPGVSRWRGWRCKLRQSKYSSVIQDLFSVRFY